MMAIVIVACGGQSGKKAFQPKERVSNLSEEERQLMLDYKRTANGINLDTLLYGHGVRFSIVQPRIQGDITEDISNRIGVKMLEIASQNGISGIGNCNFVMGAEITQTGRAATATMPQKMTVNYALTFKILNAVTGDVYATSNQDILGVGNSFEEANQNAVKEIKNSSDLQKMLQTASERIVKWYEENVQVVRNQIEKAEGEGDYALALSILSSIPEQAPRAYKLVAEKQDKLQKGMLHKQAANLLGEMEAQLASLGEDFNPAIGAYLNLIPTDCPEHATARRLYAEYEKKCKARRDALEAKAERDEQAARELEKFKMLQEHEKELAGIEADKMKCKYTSMANAKAMEKAMRYESDQKNKGFWSKLGDRILGGIDSYNDKASESDWD